MRRIAAVALSFALAIGVVACDSPKNNSGSGDTSSSASNGTASRPVADVTELSSKMVAAANEAKSVRMTFESSGGESPANGSGVMRYTPNGPELSVDMKSPDGADQVSMIMLGDDAYLKMPEGTTTSGKPWIKVSRNGTDPMSKLFITIIDAAKKSSGVDASAKLIGDAGSITDTRTEKVDGADATRYAISIDLAKASGATEDEMLKTGYQTLIAAGVKTIDYVVWVNDRDLPVKLTMDQVIPNAEGKTTSMRMTATYSDWGKPVTITAPDPAQIGELGK